MPGPYDERISAPAFPVNKLSPMPCNDELYFSWLITLNFMGFSINIAIIVKNRKNNAVQKHNIKIFLFEL